MTDQRTLKQIIDKQREALHEQKTGEKNDAW